MKKNKKKTPLKKSRPISKKILASLKKYLDRKVIDISEVRNGKIRAEELNESIIFQDELAKYDPVHGAYIYAQNKLSVLMEQIGELPEMNKIANLYGDAHEEYMPSGPPTSPLTTSYFFCWGCFDLWAGLAKETFGTVAIDVCKKLGLDEHLIGVFQNMQNSRMGFYVHEGISDDKVFLREVGTEKQHSVIVPTGYLGEPGQIWFVRIFPELFPDLNYGYSVVFTTPYVILDSVQNSIAFSKEESWISFFERNLEKTGKKDKATAYEYLMKYGLNKNYWNEYVFQGYVNYLPEVVYLAGYPDIPLSMPHSRESEKSFGY